MAVKRRSLRGDLQVMLAGEADRRPDGDRPYPGHDCLRGTQRRQPAEDRQQGFLCRIVGRRRGDPCAQSADIRGQLVEKLVQRERVSLLGSRDVLRVHDRKVSRNLP